MANRRMFSKSVVETDRFLDLPFSAQALYFHLGMEADDDGFVGSPKAVTRSIGAKDADLAALLGGGFIVLFDSGVIVIVDWRENNFIRSDRYKPTAFTVEAELMKNSPLPAVTEFGIPSDNQTGDNRYTQVRLSKDRVRLINPPVEEICASDKSDAPPDPEPERPKRQKRFVPPTLDEVRAYCSEKGYTFSPERFVAYYESNGWKVGRNPMKAWKAACASWQGRELVPARPPASSQEPAVSEEEFFANMEAMLDANAL